jgi:hypothetical protein
MKTARWFAFVAPVPAIVAQAEQERTVQITVTAVSDRSVYLDQGRGSGLRVGMVVRLFAPGAASLDVEVRSVSHNQARAELPPGVQPPPVGTRGEARVPVAAAPPPSRDQPAPPPHPPWTRQEGQRAADQPLLVPTFRQRPDERPATLDGRLFAFGQWNRDLGDDRHSEYVVGRLGVRADANNQFGLAERIRLAGELAERQYLVPDEPDGRTQEARLDLMSVAFGTEAWAPTGLEAGRFFSSRLPEIGLVDGVEIVRRYEGGLTIGGGMGFYPLPLPDRDTFADAGVHAFVDYCADERRSFAGAIGVQKTWHEGSADRDLVLLRGEAHPTDAWWLLGSAKIDFYSGSDTVKGSGAELTELYASARWDTPDLGAGLTLSHFAWPELKRGEYQELPVELVREGVVDRLSLSGSTRPSDWLHLQARADLWRDQDRDGTSFGVDGDVRDLLGQGTAIGVSLFRADGGYTSGPGANLYLRGPVGDASWRAGYRWYRYDLVGLATGPETYTRQSLEAGLSWPCGASSDLDLSFERWFGDLEDAFALGMFVQWRF